MGIGAPAVIAKKRQADAAYNAAVAQLVAITGSSKIATYFSSTGKYPANNQVPALGKDASDDFSATQLDKMEFGNTPAPKGHFIIKAFDRDPASVSGISSTALTALREQDLTRPTCVCSAFGRVWFAGTADQATQGKVFFSKIAGEIRDYERCYQQNDPTSEDLSDLLDSDGGVIPVQNCGTIVQLIEAYTGVLVLSANGVWLISGTEQVGFTATGYQVQRITDVGCIGRDSVVFADGVVYYWSDAGVYVISPTQTGFMADSLSKATIQAYYNAIQDGSKRNAEAAYDSREKVIYWLYGDDLTKPYKKNKVLAFNVELGAFIPYATIKDNDTDSVAARSFISRGYFIDSTIQENVTDSSGVTITDSLGNLVYTESTLLAEDQPSLKIASTYVAGPGDLKDIFFAEFNNVEHKDWGLESYASYVETGSVTGQDLMRNKQAQYIVNHFKRTEDGYELDGNGNVALSNQSGCFVRSKWDWTGTSNAGKWSNQQQAYRLKHIYIPLSASDPFDYAYDVVSTKLLIRGNGYSFRLRYESDGLKDFQLLGFAMPVTMEAVV